MLEYIMLEFKLEISEIISNNIFLCKNFHYNFVNNELLIKFMKRVD